ncbi:MarR family transcriptional regulator [Aquibium carbonis]|uniref:MarR family transcriptional regulator n=1 Tax=Aquibium carbonis TaxID=2495581 RepID=A0A429YQV0_9HYPH|nr:MarR family transcriptional regulator [Aquibium carbonis]RST83813.1 MarR family transcriptional regulator [Aquibium carbonis]
MSKPLKNETVGFDVTLQVKNACLCLHVQRAARSLARLFDEAFRPVGLTNGQFSMLMSLNRPMPARMREVAALLAMDRTTLTAALKTLERRGLLQVRTDPEDRRGKLLTLTDAGRETLARALPIWRDTHAALEHGLDDADGLRAALLAIS